jgi:hypothetical protein
MKRRYGPSLVLSGIALLLCVYSILLDSNSPIAPASYVSQGVLFYILLASASIIALTSLLLLIKGSAWTYGFSLLISLAALYAVLKLVT